MSPLFSPISLTNHPASPQSPYPRVSSPPPTMATDLAPAPSSTPTAAEKALAELASHKTLITTCADLLQSLSDHYSSLQLTLTTRSQTLLSNIDSHDSLQQSSLAALDLRDSSLPDLESAAAAQIESRKLSAIAQLEDPDLKLPEDLPGILTAYCQRMDSAGLWRFMLSRRRDLGTLRKEVPAAVAAAVDPLRLVLDAITEFLEQAGDGGERFWVVGMLLRAVFVDAEGRKPPEVSASIRERAAGVAEAMKAKLDKIVVGEGEVGGPESHVFLQLLAAFGLSDRFEQEFLKKLLLENASRKEMWKIVGGLGFGEKMADIIDELVKTGKVIEAVYFAHGAGLTERFPPVPLIQSYLRSSKKNASNILKNGKHSNAATEESSTLELNAIRSIIYCVEILKLEGEFPLDSLRKRLNILEKAKADRKTANKYENKRFRHSFPSSSSRPVKAGRTSNVPYASFRRNTPPARHPYSYSSQIQRSATPYGGGVSISYGGYDYGAPLAAPAQSAYPHQL